ncbi:hypothetical protein QQ045_011945 [Rhodiola kirilowii]
MAKACDKVSWLFLIRMMRALGLNEVLCDLVFRAISNYFYSILWDGSIFGRFKSNCGVRQGDPLSPSLFLICMENFSRLLNLQVARGHITPYFIHSKAI